MSSLAQTVAAPARIDERAALTLLTRDRPHDVAAAGFRQEAVAALATADDLSSALERVAALLRRSAGAARVEWWAADDGGSLELLAADGDGSGRRHEDLLGPAGLVVVLGGRLGPALTSALASLGPIIRRRRAEEQIARSAAQLALRNRVLEDFAALVAHELKTPLHAALIADDPATYLGQALDLVDELLETAQSAAGRERPATAAEWLDRATRDLGAAGLEVTADLPETLPLQPESLRVILRNLLGNAVAAGARHVHVAAERTSHAWRLHVDDDGIGVEAREGYATGSGLGLALCRRLAERLGGSLELTPRLFGGTRATVVLGASR